MIDTRRYYAGDHRVFDSRSGAFVAHCTSNTMAKRIANALNVYKVRPRKRAEKRSQSSR
jgi:hypothetical protein